MCVRFGSDLTRQDSSQMEKVGTCDWVVWMSVNWVGCTIRPRLFSMLFLPTPLPFSCRWQEDFLAELPIKKNVLKVA